MKKLSKDEFYKLLKTTEELGNVEFENDEGIQPWEAEYQIDKEKDFETIYEHYEYSVENETEEIFDFGMWDTSWYFEFQGQKLKTMCYFYDYGSSWTYKFQ